MTTKADDSIRSCAPGQDEKKWSTSAATKCTQVSPEKRHPSRQDGRRPTREAQSAREVGREGIQDARKTRTVRVEALKVVLSETPRASVEEKLWHWLTYEGRTSTLQHEEEYSLNCRPRTTSQPMNTCVGCCDTACTARATPQKTGKRSWQLHSAISN